jgi:hypothetical protein
MLGAEELMPRFLELSTVMLDKRLEPAKLVAWKTRR